MEEDAQGTLGFEVDNDESDDDALLATCAAGEGVFSAPQQVFVVKALSKATSGFRPSVTCEGFLAEVSRTATGYALKHLGSDQQLSFKYEPPSPKFCRKLPSCVSYRLQLLHGSQFLYSLRGLPRALRCQREAHAVEWGPVHVVFRSSGDMDTFLATLRYVEVQQGAEQGKQGEQAAAPAAAASSPAAVPAAVPAVAAAVGAPVDATAAIAVGATDATGAEEGLQQPADADRWEGGAGGAASAVVAPAPGAAAEVTVVAAAAADGAAAGAPRTTVTAPAAAPAAAAVATPALTSGKATPAGEAAAAAVSAEALWAPAAARLWMDVEEEEEEEEEEGRHAGDSAPSIPSNAPPPPSITPSVAATTASETPEPVASPSCPSPPTPTPTPAAPPSTAPPACGTPACRTCHFKKTLYDMLPYVSCCCLKRRGVLVAAASAGAVAAVALAAGWWLAGGPMGRSRKAAGR